MTRLFFKTVVLFTVMILLVLTTSAHAYLDAGTGSMIIQLIVGGIAGSIVLLKVFWHRVLTIIGRHKPSDNVEHNDIDEGGH